jgi:hypothetical protein
MINPSNGPGSSASTAYVAQVQRSQAAGQLVLGYVHTSWGARAWSEVQLDIDRHYSWYNVDGIFVDEAATGTSPCRPTLHHPGPGFVWFAV